MIHLITEGVINEDLSKPLAEMLAGIVYDLVELLSEDEDSALNPTGYVVDSFKCALICFYTTRTFEDAVIKAANLGGDADTIAAITGGLAGALYGYNSIPERWVDTLAPAIRTQLDRLADAAVKNREAKCR
jgi:ADP-ribosyl-[dinitrogen reductase] hydrolase